MENNNEIIHRKVKLRLSITGVASRLETWKGTPCKLDRFIVSEMARCFIMAKEQFETGNYKTVKEFFDLFC